MYSAAEQESKLSFEAIMNLQNKSDVTFSSKTHSQTKKIFLMIFLHSAQ